MCRLTVPERRKTCSEPGTSIDGNISHPFCRWRFLSRQTGRIKRAGRRVADRFSTDNKEEGIATQDQRAMSEENYIIGAGAESRLLVEPFFTTVTAVVLFTFLLQTLVDRQRAARWLASLTGSDRAQTSKLNALIKESRSVELERNKISAQDHYAKWTKLNRKLDKLNDEIKQTSHSIQTAQLSHVGLYSTVLLLVEKAPLYVLRSWYARTPVMRLESSTLFNSFGFQRFILNMPFGERNTVSTLFWCTAVDLVLHTVLGFAKDAYGAVSAAADARSSTEKPTSVPASSG